MLTGFLLNMKILHEEMKKRGIDNRLYLQDDSLCLKGVRIYEQGQATKREFVYLALDKAFLIPKKAEGAFILPDSGYFGGGTPSFRVFRDHGSGKYQTLGTDGPDTTDFPILSGTGAAGDLCTVLRRKYPGYFDSGQGALWKPGVLP